MIAPNENQISSAVKTAWEDASKELGLDTSARAPRRPKQPEGMAGRIEHTLLGIGPSQNDVERLCEEAATHDFRAVCCMPKDVKVCAERLGNVGVLVVSVVDFPLSGGLVNDAVLQTRGVIDLGAHEVDMVLDVRSVKAGALDVAADKIARVVAEAKETPVKVILETGLLTDEEIARATAASEAAGAGFVKTSTGFGPRGASVEDVTIMRALVGDRLGVKASGGIRSREDALAMVAAGADVLGTSSGVACVTEK